MARQLIAASHIGSCSFNLVLAKKDSEDYRNYRDNIPSDVDLCMKQGFAWHSGYIVCNGLGSLGAFYVELYLSDVICLDPLYPLAIVLPFTKVDQDALQIEGLDLLPFDIPSGSYQILYEHRFLEREEWENYGCFEDLIKVHEESAAEYPELQVEQHDSFPVLCRFTFVPTIDPGPPKILKDAYHSTDPSWELIW